MAELNIKYVKRDYKQERQICLIVADCFSYVAVDVALPWCLCLISEALMEKKNSQDHSCIE